MAELERRSKQLASTKNQHQLSKAAKEIAEKRARLERWSEQKLIEIDKRHKGTPFNALAFSYLTLDPPLPDSEGIREYLHFRRHGQSLRATRMKDAQGNLDAWDKIARTERDLRILTFGKGPIALFQDDAVHRQLLQLVICYEKERLTAEELVQCFDEFCKCGKENHDADALRKMRDRFEAELRAASELRQRPRFAKPSARINKKPAQ